MKKFECIPTPESTIDVIQFAERTVSEANIPTKTAMQINIAVDEMYSNIVQYSGASKAIAEISVDNNEIVLRFTDNGIPFDPTNTEDPDITLSAEERKIGGLGIFMVKKSMDSISYEYRDDLNILTIKKSY